MKPKRLKDWNYERWQTLFTAGLFIIGAVYTAAAIFQWRAMKEQSRRMEEQSKVMAQQLEIMSGRDRKHKS